MELIFIIERGLRAGVSMLVSLILWYIIPSLFLQGVDSPYLTAMSLLTFALVIGSLSALGHVFQGGPVGLVCGVGSNVATVVFLYLATSGGLLTFSEQGTTVVADFQPLLYLILVPVILSMVRKIWGAITDSVGRPSPWVEACP